MKMCYMCKNAPLVLEESARQKVLAVMLLQFCKLYVTFFFKLVCSNRHPSDRQCPIPKLRTFFSLFCAMIDYSTLSLLEKGQKLVLWHGTCSFICIVMAAKELDLGWSWVGHGRLVLVENWGYFPANMEPDRLQGIQIETVVYVG